MTFTPLSDADGRIRHVFFALPAYDDEFTLPILSCLRGIREALGSDVRCTIMHHPAQASAVQESLGSLGPLDIITWQHGFVLRLRDTVSKLEGRTLRITKLALPDFTNWVQDAFLVAIDASGQPLIWASPRVEREYGGWDDEVVRQLTAHLGWPSAVLPFGLEAGNVLVDQVSILLGAAVRAGATDAEWQQLNDRVSLSPIPDPRSAIRDPQSAIRNRTVRVCVPGLPQPVFHIDLYVTLAGVHPATGRPLALVGSIRQALALVGEEDSADDTDAGLNAVADYLVTAGYTVERLPLLPFINPQMKKPAHFSYNNCLVEIWRDAVGSTRRRVTLPVYGNEGGPLDALDRAAAGIWEGLGFEVKAARGEFALVAELYGSVRCMTKVLERADRM
ncbi:MAG: hypothetical protein WEE89_20195 [Gemmatimonadota bacterium]